MGGGSKQSSKGIVIPFSLNELELQGINLDTAKQIFSQLVQSSNFFSDLQNQAAGGFAGISKRLSQGDELSDLANTELEEIIRSGGAATTEQREQLDTIRTANIANVRDATQEGLQQVKQELAPGLGLRGSDSPILDRGGQIAREGIRAENQVNASRAQAELGLQSFNLQRGQLLSGLQQGDFDRRLALGQTSAGGSLGLLGTSNIAQQQESLRPTVTQESKGRSFSFG